MLHTIQKILPVHIIQTSNAPIEYSGGDVYFGNNQKQSQLGNIERDDQTSYTISFPSTKQSWTKAGKCGILLAAEIFPQPAALKGADHYNSDICKAVC